MSIFSGAGSRGGHTFFSVCLSWEVFISPSIVRDSFVSILPTAIEAGVYCLSGLKVHVQCPLGLWSFYCSDGFAFLCESEPPSCSI